MQTYRQGLLFSDECSSRPRATAYSWRNDPMFLRNQFSGHGKYDMPFIRKQNLDLSNVNLIACTNTIPDDEEYFDFGVHFFTDDCEFGNPYENPEKSYPIYSQYRFCCTPDYSVYGEMPIWRKIESVAHNRWCGAWWQSKGMKVVPTISWDKYTSFDYCFEGVEEKSPVAVATYACRQEKNRFLRGFDAMLERINPEAVICYGTPFAEMRGNIIPVPICHPRQFHRELKRKTNLHGEGGICHAKRSERSMPNASNKMFAMHFADNRRCSV